MTTAPRAAGGPALSAGTAALDRLQLLINRRLDGLLQGDYLGLLPGPGSEAGESREYRAGDDVRRMDWPVTARTTVPHVRLTVADRELETWLGVDLSASLGFGTAQMLKQDLALAAAAAMTHLTVRGGNRVGAVVVTGDGDLVRRPARGGRQEAQSLLRTIARHTTDLTSSAAVPKPAGAARPRPAPHGRAAAMQPPGEPPPTGQTTGGPAPGYAAQGGPAPGYGPRGHEAQHGSGPGLSQGYAAQGYAAQHGSGPGLSQGYAAPGYAGPGGSGRGQAASGDRASSGPAGLADLIDALNRPPRRRGLAVVISDFLDPPASWSRPLHRLAVRHDVLAIEVLDPRELELPDVGVLEVIDPETGFSHEVQTSDARLRRRYAQAAAAQRAEIADAVRQAGAQRMRLRTDSDWLLDLVRFVAAARQRRRTG